MALAWPEVALASSNLRPGQSRHSQLGSGLAWPRLQLLYVEMNFHVVYTSTLSVENWRTPMPYHKHMDCNYYCIVHDVDKVTDIRTN
jgi:hypothetical protein